MKRRREGEGDSDAAASAPAAAGGGGSGKGVPHRPNAANEAGERPGGGRPSGPIPEGWLDCPPFSDPIGCIIPSKVPLGAGFKEVVEPGKRYSPETALRLQRTQHHREIGLVIDLTNTSRYYNPKEWTTRNIKYVKIACRGRDEVPDDDTVNRCVFEIMAFSLAQQVAGQQQQQRKYVLVHCTHGHNRTGYMIVHAMMRLHGGTVAHWLSEFTRARPPGIYKEDYIAGLFKAYHEPRPATVVCPGTPEWKHEHRASASLGVDLNEMAADDDAAEEEAGQPVLPPLPPQQQQQADGGEAARMTNDDVLGSAVSDEHEVQLRRIVHVAMQTIGSSQEAAVMGAHSRALNSFPGSQPVSLDLKNLNLLSQRLYHVTWKADGVRYMMLLCRDGTYVIDRNFRFRRIQLRFPTPKAMATGSNEVHHVTLLDGEMVIDTEPNTGKQTRRYLIYDIMAVENMPLVQMPFSHRWEAVEDLIVIPRAHDKAVNKTYLYDDEEVKVRRKDFWLLSKAHKVLHNFIPNLSHESDGLIFQGWMDPYVPRTHEGLLKWKYAHMNSVDFLLKRSSDGEGWALLLSDRKNLRLLQGAKVMFPGGDEEGEQYIDKIIECAWREDEQSWEFMRIRTDKDHPNAWHTYTKVVASIKDNITEEVLLEEIGKDNLLPMYEEHDAEFLKQQRELQKRRQHRMQHPKQHFQQLLKQPPGPLPPPPHAHPHHHAQHHKQPSVQKQPS